MSRTYFTMSDCGISSAADLQQLLGTDSLSLTLASMLYTRYKFNWIVWENNLDEPTADKVEFWKSQLTNRWALVKDRYTVLSDALKNSPIQTSMSAESESKYNDTPQNAGAFESEPFTSNYTHSKTKQEVDIMSKIHQISTTYPNMLQHLLSEFRDLYGGLCL